jgi:hypothetical protein
VVAAADPCWYLQSDACWQHSRRAIPKFFAAKVWVAWAGCIVCTVGTACCLTSEQLTARPVSSQTFTKINFCVKFISNLLINPVFELKYRYGGSVITQFPGALPKFKLVA